MKTYTFPLGANPDAKLVCYIQDAVMPGMRVPGAVMCPGGAYLGLSPREGEGVAMSFYFAGYNAYVLYYSVGLRCAWPTPVVEASMAMKLIREHAEEWNQDPDQIVIGGFSAGGHVASGLGVFWNDAEVQQLAGCTGEENKPNALLMCYPCVNIDMPVFEDGEVKIKAIKNEDFIGAHTPPAFIVHTYGDCMVSMEQSVRFVYQMSKHDRPVEYHVYTPGDHAEVMNANSVVTQKGQDGPWIGDWMPRMYHWLDELWHPKAAPAPNPMMMMNAYTTREHFETLVCLIQAGMPAFPGMPILVENKKLSEIADNAEAMAILEEYVPQLGELKKTETLLSFSIGTWLDYAGYPVANPMMGRPMSEKAQECLNRLSAVL